MLYKTIDQCFILHGIVAQGIMYPLRHNRAEDSSSSQHLFLFQTFYFKNHKIEFTYKKYLTTRMFHTFAHECMKLNSRKHTKFLKSITKYMKIKHKQKQNSKKKTSTKNTYTNPITTLKTIHIQPKILSFQKLFS